MTRVASWAVSADPGGSLAAASPRTPRLTADLARRWDEALAAWGAPEAVRRNRERLTASPCRVVVTGQQPGPWGGPLYSFYKAATAVAVARRLSGSDGVPAVPVFWVQGDDTDWDEVGWGALPRRDLSLARHRWKESPVPSRHWVGSATLMPVPDMSEVFAEWGGDPLDLDLSPGRDLGDGFARSLLTFFGEDGLVPLDSRWSEVRGAGDALWEAYVPRHRELAGVLEEHRDVLAGENRDTPLDAETLDFGLFLLDGEHRLPVDPETWEREAAEALASGRAHTLAPSVLLRAVLQDHLLGTAVHVAGRTERAYLRQLDPLYRALSVAPPIRIARLTATLVPADTIPRADVGAVVEDPEGWLRSRIADRAPAGARASLDALRRETASRLTALGAADGEGKELAQLADAARRKIEAQLNRVEEALDRRVRRDLYRDYPRFRHLGEFVRPRRGPQERGLSGAGLAFLFGPEAPAAVCGAAEAHLDRLETGDLHHFVLEAARG